LNVEKEWISWKNDCLNNSLKPFLFIELDSLSTEQYNISNVFFKKPSKFNITNFREVNDNIIEEVYYFE
jgi:hypothetical protein